MSCHKIVLLLSLLLAQKKSLLFSSFIFLIERFAHTPSLINIMLTSAPYTYPLTFGCAKDHLQDILINNRQWYVDCLKISDDPSIVDKADMAKIAAESAAKNEVVELLRRELEAKYAAEIDELKKQMVARDEEDEEEEETFSEIIGHELEAEKAKHIAEIEELKKQIDESAAKDKAVELLRRELEAKHAAEIDELKKQMAARDEEDEEEEETFSEIIGRELEAEKAKHIAEIEELKKQIDESAAKDKAVELLRRELEAEKAKHTAEIGDFMRRFDEVKALSCRKEAGEPSCLKGALNEEIVKSILSSPCIKDLGWVVDESRPGMKRAMDIRIKQVAASSSACDVSSPPSSTKGSVIGIECKDKKTITGDDIKKFYRDCSENDFKAACFISTSAPIPVSCRTPSSSLLSEGSSRLGSVTEDNFYADESGKYIFIYSSSTIFLQTVLRIFIAFTSTESSDTRKLVSAFTKVTIQFKTLYDNWQTSKRSLAEVDKSIFAAMATLSIQFSPGMHVHIGRKSEIGDTSSSSPLERPKRTRSGVFKG
jgi:hypothetical protein